MAVKRKGKNMTKREFGKVEYLIWQEREKMSYLDIHNYNKNVHNLARDMRALIAYQDNATTINGDDKMTINSVVRRCGLQDAPNYVNSRIMQEFLGAELFNRFAMPLYDAKAKYDAMTPADKKNVECPKSPIDYFSIPTMYHFYRFRDEILRLMKSNNFAKSGTVKLVELDNVLRTAKTNYLDTSDYNNMYFNPQSDIMINQQPLAAYVPIKELQRRIDKNGINGEEISVAADKLIKAEVTGYMLSYIDKIKNLSTAQIDEIRGLYTSYSRRYIDDNLPAIANQDGTITESKSRKFMLDMCNYGGKEYIIPSRKNVNKAADNGDLTAAESKEIAASGYGYEKETGQLTLI